MGLRQHVGVGLIALLGLARCSPPSSPHDVCYLISRGKHASIACLTCHKSLPDAGTYTAGTCSTGTAACNECHDHLCSGPTGTLPTDLLHQPPKAAAVVPGYVCGSSRCYACHKEVAAPQ